MQVTRFDEAQRYEVPKHQGMCAFRLQGLDASDAQFAWVGLSHFLPGGAAEMDAGPLEKIYVVLAGIVSIELAHGSVTALGPRDSCYIPGGEARAVQNRSNEVATMLVMMPHPPGARS